MKVETKRTARNVRNAVTYSSASVLFYHINTKYGTLDSVRFRHILRRKKLRRSRSDVWDRRRPRSDGAISPVSAASDGEQKYGRKNAAEERGKWKRAKRVNGVAGHGAQQEDAQR